MDHLTDNAVGIQRRLADEHALQRTLVNLDLPDVGVQSNLDCAGNQRPQRLRGARH